MAEELTRTLVRRAERGTPRGAAVVLTAAQRQVAADRDGHPLWRTGPAIAFAAAAFTLFVGGGLLLATRLLLPDTSPIATIPESPTVLSTTTVPMSGGDVGATDQIFDVALAPDGKLWAATAGGVVEWDLATASPTVFSEVDGLGGRSVYGVAVAADGTVWAAGDSWLAYYDGTWTVVGDQVLTDPVRDLAVGPDGTVWVVDGDDALIRFDAGRATSFGVPGAAISISVDPAGTIWMSTMQSGVLAFDGEWHYFSVDHGLPSDVVGNVAVAPDGSVWVGGDGLYGDPGGDIPAAGIAHFDGSTWTSFTTADGLLSNDGGVAVGPDGDVWVIHTSLPDEVADALGASLPSGLSRYDGTRWETYPNIPTGYGRGAAVSADGTLWMPWSQGIVGFDGTASRLLVAGTEAVPPPGPPGPAVSLEPAEGFEPVRLSTSIGEIEFTTWIRADGEEPAWEMTETAHGIIGHLGPDGTPAWSLDGITWTEIRPSVEPRGWSDRSAADGDDVFVWSVDDGVGRTAWDGTGWTEAETFYNPLLDGASRTVAGPRGIVAVRGDRVYYWDGTGFTEAAQPPDPLLHPGSSAGCAAQQDRLGWGIMKELAGPVIATDNGFVALAARSEDDWHRFPVCEPLVWFSPDGNEWLPTTDESPFGEGSVVRDLAVAGGRIVAVGGTTLEEAGVWASDDGITWERTDFGSYSMLRVAGGARGWIAVGHGDMWFSPDGLVWDGPYQRPPGWADIWNAVGVAMLDDRIIGVGELRDGGEFVSSGVVVGVFVDE